MAVRHAVSALPAAQRTVVALRYFVGMSVAETAAVMGVSEGSVKQHMHRATVALRGQFFDAPAREGTGCG